MTVKELIELLQKFPKDAEIVSLTSDEYGDTVECLPEPIYHKDIDKVYL
jgi:hypothetical protein